MRTGKTVHVGQNHVRRGTSHLCVPRTQVNAQHREKWKDEERGSKRSKEET